MTPQQGIASIISIYWRLQMTVRWGVADIPLVNLRVRMTLRWGVTRLISGCSSRASTPVLDLPRNWHNTKQHAQESGNIQVQFTGIAGYAGAANTPTVMAVSTMLYKPESRATWDALWSDAQSKQPQFKMKKDSVQIMPVRSHLLPPYNQCLKWATPCTTPYPQSSTPGPPWHFHLHSIRPGKEIGRVGGGEQYCAASMTKWSTCWSMSEGGRRRSREQE